MNIRAIEVRNWGCIESLSLADLKDGINILHGPNCTGKSSLVQAIRSGLFDHFHDSQDSTLLAAIPWRTKASPHVAIEFDHAGGQYRIAKTFAKTKDGQATLEQKGAGGWTVLNKGKEAAKQVRELVGAESSGAGVFQMLWLGQRDFALPMPRDIDPTLQKSLESVLGNLITGRDLVFKARLDKANERWFTVKTMKDRKDSPVTRLTADLEQARIHKTEIDRQWTDAEASLQQYDLALDRQPKLQADLQEALAELERVQKERESIAVRKARYDLARQNLQAEERQRKQAQQRLDEWDATQKALARAEQTLQDAGHQLRAADEKLLTAQRAADQAKGHHEIGERELSKHQQERSALDDRQQLLNLWMQCQALDRNLEQVEESARFQKELEDKLVGPAIVSETQIDKLRQNRHQAAELRAHLAAAEIHVTIEARTSLSCAAAIDGQRRPDVSLPAEKAPLWLVRQQAEFTLGDLAVLRITRGKEDRDLEATAARLADLERDYRQQLDAAFLDPDQPHALDDLVKRRLEHEARRIDLQRVRDAIAKAAPAGLPALQSHRRQLGEQQEALRARRPELQDWTPNQADTDQARLVFEIREAELRDAIQVNKLTQEKAAKAVQVEWTGQQKIKNALASQEFEVKNLSDKLAQQDRPALAAALAEGQVRLAHAQAKVQESTLSEEEQAIETRYQSIRAAHANRAERLRSNEIGLAELRSKLAGTEGLHQKRIQAEQAVADKMRELERESLHANAHKHLKEHFEQLRQEQVGRTVGPINDRVMGWMQRLGLNDYTRLSFGNELLPDGLVANHFADGAPIDMGCESYGTLEQLSLLVRLAVGGLLSRKEAGVAILDDPLAHADLGRHRKMIEILASACRGEPHGPHPTGPLQLIILTCHAERFDYLDGAQQFDLAQLIRRGG